MKKGLILIVLLGLILSLSSCRANRSGCPTWHIEQTK